MNIKNYLFILFLPILCVATLQFEEPWGKDAILYHKNEKKEVTKELSWISKAADSIIKFKQKFISPIDGPRSSFRPTSSKYMQLAIHRYGFFKGFIMGCDRLLRENNEPWVYRTIMIDGIKYKFDPATHDKFSK